MKSVKLPIGGLAPDFSLLGANDEPHELRSLRGQNVLLVFYRGHW